MCFASCHGNWVTRRCSHSCDVQINWDPTQFDLTVDQFPKVPILAGANSITASQEFYNPQAPVDRFITMIPVQMHWHVVSEHSLNGNYVRSRSVLITRIAVQ